MKVAKVRLKAFFIFNSLVLLRAHEIFNEDDDELSRCQYERQRALKSAEESGIPLFVPVCGASGDYAAVQCHQGTGYCWCVDVDDGKPVQGSSRKYQRPQCGNGSGKGKRGKRRNRGREGGGRTSCSHMERRAFNSDVVEIVRGEFSKQKASSSVSSSKQLVTWKFDQMDANKDGKLRKREFKAFREAVRELTRSKKCARNFWRYCDLDSDKRITRAELNTCLGVDGVNIAFSLFSALSSNADQKPTLKASSPKRRRRHKKKRKKKPKEETEPEILAQEPEPVVLDCWTERRKSTNGNYVPECNSDGTFHRVQCYKSSGYCWCVEASNGRPIPGTSVQNATPTCASSSFSSRNPQWKKCPGPKRRLFQQRLVDYIMKSKRGRGRKGNRRRLHHHRESADLVVEWQFSQLDVDGNAKLSRKELRPFRMRIKAIKELKLCGKRIQFHCDVDGDKFVDEAEWRFCVLGVKLDASSSMISTSPMESGKRRGPNPLKTWLKDD